MRTALNKLAFVALMALLMLNTSCIGRTRYVPTVINHNTTEIHQTTINQTEVVNQNKTDKSKNVNVNVDADPATKGIGKVFKGIKKLFK